MSKLEQLVNRLKGSSAPREIGLGEVFSPERIEGIKKRELKRFREAQDKKWRHWLDSVSR